jgi:hypothetical protein
LKWQTSIKSRPAPTDPDLPAGNRLIGDGRADAGIRHRGAGFHSAEFIGARNGIGHSLFLSWTFLDTPALFDWILMAFALLGLVEFGVLKPIRDYLMRWKRTI